MLARIARPVPRVAAPIANVQQRAEPSGYAGGRGHRLESASVRHAADRGTRGVARSLPHLDAIQRSFGKHDVSRVRAYTDDAAVEGARAMGASAFTIADRVAFARPPDLYTAAHEAAHVVQQRGGVHLDGGVGEPGDSYEQHADAVAERVSRGESAEALLDRHSPAAAASSSASMAGAVQMQCDHCHNILCDNGSLCGWSGTTYSVGQHGNRRSEQQRLTSEYGFQVSGQTHQSEHPFGFAVVNQSSGQQRGSGTQVRRFENELPAYQEQYQAHRDHVGTGSSHQGDIYRHDQRSLIETGDVSSAMQLNLIGYAQQPSFVTNSQTPQGQAATDSYQAMVGSMQSLPYMTGQTQQQAAVMPQARLEMLVSRWIAENGRYPTSQEMQQFYNMVYT